MLRVRRAGGWWAGRGWWRCALLTAILHPGRSLGVDKGGVRVGRAPVLRVRPVLWVRVRVVAGCGRWWLVDRDDPGSESALARGIAGVLLA
eukprot:4257167-Alexandrium_andersonii.AAC.1